MISLHTVYVVTIVCQATTTMVLFLLAWNDRRFRGLTQLAFACALHVLAIGLNPLWRDRGLWVPQAVAISLLPCMFFLMHAGLRAFFGYRAQRPRLELASLAAAMLLIAGVTPVNRLLSIQLGGVFASVILVLTIRMLWQAGTGPVRLRARTIALLMALILIGFLVRMPLEYHTPHTPLMLLLRKCTVVSITLLAFSFLALYLAESSRRHHLETRLDALTGMPNRRAMEEAAAGQIRLAQRSATPLALLMMDLDSFKVLNDTYGHAVGDRALCDVGEVLLAATLHTRYTVARLGGEEFAMLLPKHTLATAESLAEELRSAIAGIVLHEGNRRVTLTVSIGVAAWQPREATWTSMLRRADTALYRAKRDGRNRVVLSTEDLDLIPNHHRPGEAAQRSSYTLID